MDEFLESQGLWRKHIPKDSSCLFRAVSETIFYCQTCHDDVRRDCVKYLRNKKELFEHYVDGDYEEYLYNVSNPKVWAGLVEMSALALMYRHDFLIYHEIGQSPSLFTKNNFDKKFVLCYSQGNHYDLVYSKERLGLMAFCQSLVYGILYKNVFKLGEDVDYAVQKMLYDKTYSKKKKNLALPYFRTSHEKKDKCRIKEIDDEKPNGESCSEIREMLAQGCPPFPYKVAKALDPEIYRNVEYDRWNQARREQERAEQLVVPDYAPGVKCLVRLETQMFHAHIQEMIPDHGPVTVFIEELGEKKIVPFDNLQPLAIPVHKALAMHGFNCKTSLRLLDGSLKASSLTSFSTIVTDAFRSPRRFLKKKVKDFTFMMPMGEKLETISWTNSNNGTTNSNTSSLHQPMKKQPPRFLSEKVKIVSQTRNEEKTLSKANLPEMCSENISVQAGSSHQQSNVQSSSTFKLPFPQVQGTKQQGLNLSSAAPSPVHTTPPPFQPVMPANSLTYPYLPYSSLAPLSANGNTGELSTDTSFLNSGFAVDSFGFPFFYTCGNYEVPYFLPPIEWSVQESANGGGMGLETLGATTSANGTIMPTAAPAQSGSFWTHNRSITYLSTPVAGLNLFDWALSDDTNLGIRQIPTGFPFLYYVSPQPNSMAQPLTSGVVTPPFMSNV